jgi:hypothetical protein
LAETESWIGDDVHAFGTPVGEHSYSQNDSLLIDLLGVGFAGPTARPS